MCVCVAGTREELAAALSSLFDACPAAEQSYAGGNANPMVSRTMSSQQ